METTAQIIVGVRRLLRRPSDLKLSDEDIRAELTDLCKGYVQQQSLSPRDRTSAIVETQFTEAPVDYYVQLQDVGDFEEQSLEYQNVDALNTYWSRANIVPLSTWDSHYAQPYVAASFYGSLDESSPAFVRINLTPEQVLNRLWRLTYRESLIQALQMDERPPLPVNHLPMLKREAAILLMPQVKDDSAEWVEWMKRTLPIYEQKLGEQKRDWVAYLEDSVEQEEQPIRRSDRYGNQRQVIRPFVPFQ